MWNDYLKRGLQIIDKLCYLALFSLGFYYIYDSEMWQQFKSKKTSMSQYDEPVTEFPTFILSLLPIVIETLGKDYNISITLKIAETSTHGNLTIGDNLLDFNGTVLNVTFLKIPFRDNVCMISFRNFNTFDGNGKYYLALTRTNNS